MGFKLGYSTLRWQTPDFEKLLTQLKDAGWDGWEMRQSLDWVGTPKRIRQICDNAGLPVAVVTARGLPIDKDPNQMELNKRRMDFAAEVEADCFMFMGAGKPKDRPLNDSDIAALADVSEEWAEYAAQYDLEICYHIHTNTTVDSIEDWAKYMSLLRKCKLCIDVSHSALWGYDPIESIRRYRDSLIYVHLQDYGHTSGGGDTPYQVDWVEVGSGTTMDFPGIMRTLEEIGYDRWVTACPGQVENRSDEERMRVNREYLRELGY
ncbi:sugar phosphate isomerase/epimerase [Candidatus Poribacteria bacterium]|nr:sugar phosphate isomerase/epimerase [Candidatus Poribacteria bacterium]